MPTTVFNDSSLTFLPWNPSHPQFSRTGLNNISAGTSSSCDSSSSSVSSSSSHENSNSPLRSPDTTTLEDVTGAPYLRIMEEPYNKFRFRYKTEMHGTHGAILGFNSQKNKQKIYPKVKLCNYKPDRPGAPNPIIRCTLYTADEDEKKRTAHVHRLVGKCTGEETDDPHDIVVRTPNYTAVFQNMTILYTKKEEQLEELVKKKKHHLKRQFVDTHSCKILSIEQLRASSIEELENMNLNMACLRFDALIEGGHGRYVRLCPPQYSTPISNMKNPQTNELRICRVDKVMGSCQGREEVFMFVEKVVKKNIKVKFYEEDENREITWLDYAEFSPEDVHHQYGIVFKTPPYHSENITENVLVYFQLERPSDGAVSEPRKFEYTPNPNRVRELTRKRPRLDDISNFPTTVLEYQNQKNNPVLTAPSPATFPDTFQEDTCDDLLNVILNDLQKTNHVDQQPLNDAVNSMNSSNASLTQMLSTIPPASAEALEMFLSGDRIPEYLELIGELGTGLQLMSGEVTSSNNHDVEMEFDGICNWTKAETDMEETAIAEHQSFAPSTNSTDAKSHTASLQFPKGYKSVSYFSKTPMQRLTEKLRASSVREGLPNQKLDTNDIRVQMDDRSTPKFVLNYNNLVKKVEQTFDNLVIMFHKGKLSEKRFRDCLIRLFSCTVGPYEDSAFHILAVVESIPLPPECIKFMQELQMRNISEVVVNSINLKKETPLLLAAQRGLPQMTELLLRAGADVDATDRSNNTPAHLAVLRDTGALDTLAILLRHKPNLNKHNQDGFTVLHLAVVKRKSDIISTLLIKSEDDSYNSVDLINTAERKQGNTALHIAVNHRFKEIITLLLNFEERIDVNKPNYEGKTPLAYVWDEDDPESKEIQDLLISSKADPSMVQLEKRAKKEYNKDEEEDEDSDSDSDVLDVYDEVDETQSAYAREWGEDSFLFDGATISKLCPLLDENDDWEVLARKLNFKDTQIDYCRIHWSPSILTFKIVTCYKPEVTAEIIRDHLLSMAPRLRCGVQYIDDFLLQKMGL